MSNLKIDQEDFNRKAQHILDTVVRPQVERYEKAKAAQQKNKMNKMTGFYDLMDSGMAEALGTDVETYVMIIEDHCTMEEAEIIFNGIWFEKDEAAARELFASKLKEL